MYLLIMNNETTLQIGRLTFTVTFKVEYDRVLGREVKVYTLTGKRNAVYSTMRNVHNPHLMFLVNNRKIGIAMKGVWLTDKNNILEVF